MALFFSLTPEVYGQEIYWANRLLGYSSEYRPHIYGEQYRASQILGPPQKLPQTGDSPCAWSPAEADGKSEEWIKVGFSKPLHPKQILIGENHNPGAISRVYAYDNTGKEYLIAQEDQLDSAVEKGRLLSIRPGSIRVF